MHEKRRLLGVLIPILILFLSSCGASSSKKKEKVRHETTSPNKVLDSVLAQKKIRAVTDYGSVSYLIYRGETIGYQYELLQQLSEFLDVELELILEKDLNKSIEMLKNEEVDIIAMALTITADRKSYLEFTLPIMTTQQMLVQRLPENFRKMGTRDEIESHLLRNQIDLADKTVYVQSGTIYASRLATLADEIGDTIHIIEEDKDIEELISAVANGEIDYTVADKYLALVNARYYDNIDINTPISFPQNIAWAVKKGQSALADTINSWLNAFNDDLLSRILYNKYFKNIRAKRIAKSQYSSFSGGSLSPFDNDIKEGSQILGWDWRLLAAMIYQESEFKPNVSSWVGAYGLMQMMPNTFKKYGIDTTASPRQQIIAGSKYLRYLDRQLPEEISDSIERIKFTLASYNSGLGHILDARRLAKKYNKNENIWSNNVDHFVLNLSDKSYYHDTVVYYGYLRGEETYNFVNEIFKRHEDYRNLINE